jgi:hypothetical protein
VDHDVSFTLGELNGPGVYTTTTGATYQRGFTTSGDYTYETFQGAGPTCVATLTEAPVGQMIGAKIAGSFRCSGLVDPTDTRREVTLYEGALDATMTWPPAD